MPSQIPRGWLIDDARWADEDCHPAPIPTVWPDANNLLVSRTSPYAEVRGMARLLARIRLDATRPHQLMLVRDPR